MNKLMVVKRGIRKAGKATALVRTEDLEPEVEAAVDLSVELLCAANPSPYAVRSMPALRAAVQRAEEAIESGMMQRWSEAIENAFRLATPHEIKEPLAAMLGSFPNISKSDLRIYGRYLVEDVADARPTAVALAIACRLIRRTCTFAPAIAEVLRMLRSIEERLRSAPDHIGAIPDRLAAAKAMLESERRWQIRRAEMIAAAGAVSPHDGGASMR